MTARVLPQQSLAQLSLLEGIERRDEIGGAGRAREVELTQPVSQAAVFGGARQKGMPFTSTRIARPRATARRSR